MKKAPESMKFITFRNYVMNLFQLKLNEPHKCFTNIPFSKKRQINA